MTDEAESDALRAAGERRELEAQMQAATDAIQDTVRRMLRDGDIHPHLVLVAMARVTGGLTAAAALAERQEVKEMLSDVAELVRQAGLEHHEELQAVLLPVAGKA